MQEIEQYDEYDEEEYEGGEEFQDLIQTDIQEERIVEEIEYGKSNEFYNVLYVQKLLQMVNSLASVSSVNAYASHVLFNISHPNRIGTLIGILFNGSSSLKVLAIKIFEHLVTILPPELFEESVKLMIQNQKQETNQSQILKNIKTISNLGEANQFTKLLFNYLINIRNKIWIRKYESPGMYGISNALSNLLRKMFENSIWRHIHEQELKNSIYQLTKLPYQEKEAVISLFGADMQGLTVGTTALDKNENKVTILGFTDHWIEDLNESIKKGLKVPETHMNIQAQTNKVIGLYLNENTIDQNEILILDPQELVLIHEERNLQNQLPIKDLLMEKDLLKNLIQEGIISLTKGKNLSIEEQNFKISITKIIFSLINERQEQFIDFLKQQQMGNIFNDFLNLLFDESCKILKTPITLQLDWVEQKCFEIRKQACESKATLTKNQQVQAQIVMDKVFLSSSQTQKERQFNDYDLVGALNYDNIVDMQLKVDFYRKDEKFRTPEFLIINGPDLYTEDGLIRLGESEVALTCDLNLDEYLIFLDRQERKVKGVSDKPLIMLDREDFNEIQLKYKSCKLIEKESHDIETENVNDLEQAALTISNYSGFEFKNVLSSLKNIENDLQLTNMLNNLVKKEQKRKEEELKKQKQKKNSTAVSNEIEEIQDQDGLLEEGEVLEFVKPMTNEEKQKKQRDREIIEREEMNQIVMELVNQDNQNEIKFDLKERLKYQEWQNSELFSNIKGFTLNNIYKQYQESLNLLFTLYSRRILQKIVTLKFEETIPLMMNSKDRKQQFKQFLKIISNEAVLVKFNTRNKRLLVKINELLKRIVIKCQQDDQYKPFIDELFQVDVLKASKDLIQSLKNEKQRSIKSLFSSEKKATKFSNPYFILGICQIFLEHCQEDILKEVQLPILIEQLLTLSYLCSSDPELKIQINEFILNVLESVQKNYNKLSMKLKTQLQEMWLLKNVVEKLTFNASSTTSIYPRHQLLLLEILMKLLHLKKASKKGIHSIYTKNETILKIQRAKDVMKETNSYKLLQYLLHYQKLSPEQQTIKNSYETTHKLFDTKFSAQFKIDEIEKMVLTFDKNTEIEPDTAVAITRDEEGKEILDVIFSNEITNSTLDIYDENVYMHYPCRPYTIYAFGDSTHGKLGINQTAGQFENPTIIKNLFHKVKDIQTYNLATVIQLEDGSLYKSGYKEYWPQNNKQIVQKWDKKAQTFSLGCRHTLVVNERGKLQGEGVSNAGGLGVSDYENKTWISVNFKEKISQISCGYDFSFIVSTTGNLYCAGGTMFTKLNLPNQNKFQKIDLGQSVKVKKVASGYTQMALIIVINQGVNELWSAGYNLKGTLGSGENVTTKSTFGKLDYDSTSIEFIDIDIYSEHASAITSDHQLYQWGWNQFGRCGHRDYDKQLFQPNIWEPKKVQFFTNYIVREAKCGSCHTIVLASHKDFPDKRQVFTYGREDQNCHFLGVPKEEAIKEDQFIKHLKRFDHLKVYKVEAGLKCTFVCCEGEDELFDKRYTHKEASCDNCKIAPIKGPLHFTIEENNFKYWCNNCVKSGTADLPKISFAIKNNIEEIEQKNWPNLQLIQENIEEGGKQFLCDFNKQLFSTEDSPLYISFSKLLESIDEFKLCEDSFSKSNCNDLNPIIYLRIAKGYRPINLEKFPTFDLQEYYKKSDYYGLRFQLSPDFQYTINQKILEETQDQYQAFLNEMKIFDSKLDEELYNFIEDYQYQHRYIALKDINENLIEINEKRFSDKLKKLPDSLKKKRLRLLLSFNRYAQQLIPFIDYNTKLTLGASARLNAYFMKAKEFIMYGVKSQYQTNYINRLQIDNQKKDVNINRMRAAKFFESGRIDHTGEYTVFGQVFKGLRVSKYSCLRVNNSSERAFNAKFIGEGSIDVGGPYRETIYEICKELQSHVLPLLVKTQNQKNDFGEHRDKWIPSSSACSPSHLAMFEFLGALIGMSIRCSQILNLNFPSLFWKKLIDEPLDRSDLNMIDTYCLQMLDGIKNLSQTLTEKEFQEYHDQKFVTCLTDGSEIELVPGGKNKILTQDNVEDYIQLVMNARLNEFDKQMKAIKRGIGLIFPQFLMKIYTWKELEYKVCGKPSIDLHHLKAISKYAGCTEDDETVKRFWRVLESFSDEEKSLYLKFVWGRSRLPLVDEKFGDKHTIKLINPQNCDQSLPIAHTCFFAIDIPMYSTEEIMRDKFLYAIKFCQAIDTDGSPYEILGEDSDGDF